MNTPTTILFSPGDSRRKIEKGAASTADALLIDLEDGVAPSMKEAAREQIQRGVGGLKTAEKLWLVRINGWSTGRTEGDIAALAGSGIDGVVLPKAESAEDIQRLRQVLQQSGEGELQIYALIESARGILRAGEIAAETGLRGLMLGGEDYLASIEGKKTAGRAEILYARSAVVTAARAYGLEAVDTIFIQIDDVEGVVDDAALARALGFSGKLCIHPDQIEPVRRAFRATEKETSEAQAIVAAYEEHSQHGIGVFSFEGRMIDEAVVRQMRQLL